jgi:DNA repair exonuclease SbcCD nuclease subunit
MPFSFIHAADLHLDSPFEGLAATRPDLATRLRDASLQAFDALVEAALKNGVDFVVLAGDLYDGARRGLRAQLRLKQALERLSAQGIHCFLAHGNHDPVEEGWSAIRSWPKHVHIFPADSASTTTLSLRGETVHVHGTSYPRSQQTTSLLPRFSHPTKPGFHLAVLHANVGGQAAHAAYSPCTVEELASKGMHYWALGHIHRASVLRERAPRIVYPGNLQGRSFKPSEQGPKGALLVTVDGERIQSRALDLAPIRFAEVEVDIEHLVDLPSVTTALYAAVEPLRSPERELIVRGRLVGRGAVSDDLRQDPDLRELLQGLSDAAPEGLTWVRLRDETAPELELESIAAGDDLPAAVLDAARALATVDGVRQVLSDHPAFKQFPALLRDIDLTNLGQRATLDALAPLLDGGES